MKSSSESLRDTARLLVEVLPAVNRTLRTLVLRGAGPTFTLAQYRVLVHLGDHPLLSLKELADREGVEPPTMSRTVESLVTRGWVSREADPRDRRFVRIALAKQGRALVAEVRAQVAAEVASRLDVWPAEQLDRLAQSLDALRSSSLHPVPQGELI